MYRPDPVDTSGIELPEELVELTEKLAENVHENWAKSRVDEGWTFGDSRDDINKTTPCLVPYSELPNIEKEYDRKTALETLKFIIYSGFKIQKDN